MPSASGGGSPAGGRDEEAVFLLRRDRTRKQADGSTGRRRGRQAVCDEKQELRGANVEKEKEVEALAIIRETGGYRVRPDYRLYLWLIGRAGRTATPRLGGATPKIFFLSLSS